MTIASSRDRAVIASEPKGRLVRRQRNLASRPAWRGSDITIAGSLAALLAPSWVFPEATWASLCGAVARIPALVDRRLFAQISANIGAALGTVTRSEADSIATDLQAAVYELRMQNLRALRPGGWRPEILLKGEEHLLGALAGGRGAILWVAHFAFNSNITKIALHRRGHRVSHLSRPEHGFSKTRFGVAVLNRVRCMAEDRHLAERIVFDRHAPAMAMRRIVSLLRRGGIVSITAGAWEASDLVVAPFLGGRLSIAVGAPRLASRTGAALLPVFTVRDPVQGFMTVIEPPIAVAESQTRELACIDAACDFVRGHEHWVRRYPEQWRGWKEWQV